MNDDKLKPQILFSIESDEDLDLFLKAYQISDFVNAIDEILSTKDRNINALYDILEKHDILKFFTPLKAL